jgi:hypothetical protein
MNHQDDEKFLELLQRVKKSLEKWEFVGLGLNETEYRLAKTAAEEENTEALDFILDNSGWARVRKNPVNYVFKKKVIV